MSQDANIKDGFKELLQTQMQQDIPDFLESGIMAKIEARPKRASLPINLQSVFILSVLASLYVLVAILSVYYYPQIDMLKDCKTMLGLSFFLKLCYDLNELMPKILAQFSFSKKLSHR